ncbi:hypothetical protein [Allonocardiopsis opalescens]|uniref:Uncharacterized protein n=1 Tax=Allonocardiopsis opalescens TaxID=1144618 RepID=A0A2T0PSX5_9ACTN|nr:hypothetical protein [Allonocardiopsis opalescens]PRX92004.1 hypothetical protein CLV72_11277 [Allonocardiopsis opalescens]
MTDQPDKPKREHYGEVTAYWRDGTSTVIYLFDPPVDLGRNRILVQGWKVRGDSTHIGRSVNLRLVLPNGTEFRDGYAYVQSMRRSTGKWVKIEMRRGREREWEHTL